MTWEEVAGLPSPPVAVLPVGAVEAHGPHLPLATDVIIAEAMAREGGARLAARGHEVVLLPALAYTAAPFAAAFAGTLSLRPETATALVVDIRRALAVANAPLDPTHLGSLHAAVRELRETTPLAVAFPDLTRKPWAPRLTEEFRTGACHAGRFEGSVVLAERPEWVRDAIRTALPPNWSSLSVAIREGKRTFEEAGGPRAYFGDPAAASAAEGRATVAALGEILAEAVEEALRAAG